MIFQEKSAVIKALDTPFMRNNLSFRTSDSMMKNHGIANNMPITLICQSKGFVD